MARWLRWLERRPVTAEVVGSSPIRVVKTNIYYSLHGWVPERPKGTDCKSVVTDFDGSNPSPPIYSNLSKQKFLEC